MKWFFFTFVLVLVLFGSLNARGCPPNEHYDCGTPCPLDCTSFKGAPAICRTGTKCQCYCDYPLIRECPDPRECPCIPRSECPS
ncbi:hypothetical protein AVEN_199033-1 [Araneus ventricosus]|uniref:TIL domain-containing protein n=1 Tax=Araneus ventricosus TaxID=182803 RepID=A0A4Y2G654_ARAVE|nr:hypothetical protein AVEN_199033-1 [Araneus ventricosus]